MGGLSGDFYEALVSLCVRPRRSPAALCVGPGAPRRSQNYQHYLEVCSSYVILSLEYESGTTMVVVVEAPTVRTRKSKAREIGRNQCAYPSCAQLLRTEPFGLSTLLHPACCKKGPNWRSFWKTAEATRISYIDLHEPPQMF